MPIFYYMAIEGHQKSLGAILSPHLPQGVHSVYPSLLKDVAQYLFPYIRKLSALSAR